MCRGGLCASLRRGILFVWGQHPAAPDPEIPAMRTPTLPTAALRRAAALLRSATDELGEDAFVLLCAAAFVEDQKALFAEENEEEGSEPSFDPEDVLVWTGDLCESVTVLLGEAGA